MEIPEILQKLPYSHPFLFVDDIQEISETAITGTYIFKANAFFYKGHFKDNPVTPGVILTECMAQIGLVCLGIYLMGALQEKKISIAFTSSEVEFFLPVFPGEKVKVVSEKKYFRFQKLKCHIKMFNSENKLVCKGILAGMLR